jgi:hypothetical protein
MPAQPISEGSRRAILTIAISAIALETALLGLIAPLLPEIENRTGAGDAALGSPTASAVALCFSAGWRSPGSDPS